MLPAFQGQPVVDTETVVKSVDYIISDDILAGLNQDQDNSQPDQTQTAETLEVETEVYKIFICNKFFWWGILTRGEFLMIL